MKTKKVIMLISILILGLFAFTSCSKHTHKFDEAYSYDSQAHWQEGVCEHTDIIQNYGLHEYGEWIIIKAASHTEDGSKKQVCYVCGYENVVKINALGHSFSNAWKNDSTNHWHECSCGDKKDKAAHTYGEFEVIKEATDTQNGSKKQVCSVCGYENVLTIPATGHTFNAPIWTWDGYKGATAKFTCENNSSHVEEVPATISSKVTTPATCDDEGERTYTAKVTFKGKTYTNEKTEVIPAFGHSYGTISWIWDGCTAATAKFTCENNNSHVEEVPATITSEVTTPATCETAGERTYTATVTFEGKTYTKEKTEEIPALGHSFTNYISNNDATSTQDGTKTATCDHDGCNETDTIIDEGTMLGHVYINPVWNWDGYETATLTFTCQTCGAELNHTETANATIASEITTPATCETTGVRTYTATVIFAGETYTSTKTEEIEATGHSDGSLVWVWNEYSSATAKFICGNDESHIEEVSATITNEITTNPTCETTGERTYTATVTFKGVTYTDKKTEEIPALGHSYGTISWIWDGYTAATAKFTCENNSSHIEEISATITNEVTPPATCEETGIRTYTATVTFGGITYTDTKTEEIPSLGHSFTNYVSNNDATCTVDGTKSATCEHEGCNEIDTVVDIDSKLGHDLEHHDAKAPTCTKIGWEAYDTCSRCDYTTYVEIPANGHTYGEWIIDKEATCTEDGMKHRVCTICNEVENRVIEMYGHNLIHHDAKAPTCTQKGWEAYDTCSRGDYTTYVEIEATGHTKSDWIIDEEATCTKDGSKHKECTICGEVLETATIDMLGHDLEHHDAKAPTCTDVGWEAYDTCSRCDYTTYVEIEANGHTESDWIIDEEATCTEGGSKHKECTVCHEILKTEDIDPLGHSFTNYVSNNDATSTEDGTKTAVCDRDGCNETDTITDEGSMLGHEYSTPVWNWNGYESATATFTCTNCEENTHKETVNATITNVIKTPVTCTSDGFKTYTAKVTFGGIDYSDEKDEVLTMLGHDYVAQWNWISYESVEVTFTCSHDNNHSGSATITGDDITYEITTPATCESDGVKTYTATASFEGKDYIDQKTETILATGHGNWNDNVCGNCGYDAGGSKGLNMAWDSENETFSVNGIGDCTENNIEIPATYNGYPVTKIGSSAFKNCSSIISLTIQEGISIIGESAFENCKAFESVSIGKGITEIKNNTFKGCSMLTDIVIPEGVTSIGSSAFENCSSITSIKLPKGLNKIGDSAFRNMQQLVSINLPQGLESVGRYAFYQCFALTEIEFPNSVTEIGEAMFYGCGELISANIPEKISVVPTTMFAYCSKLKEIKMHDNVKSIGFSSFAYCKAIETISLPQSLTLIEGQGFLGCESLVSITLPESLVEIESDAFKKCYKLKSVSINKNLKKMGDNVFSNCTELEEVFANGDLIGNYAFAECTKLNKVVLSEGLTTIGDYAFKNCSSIETIILPESILSIGNNAFEGCSAIQYSEYNNARYLTMGTNTLAVLVKVLDSSITAFEINELTKIVSDYAFAKCSNLTSITIPDNVTSIGKYTFSECSSLTQITIGNGVTSIGDYAFANCTFESITIPNNVTIIGEGLFNKCINLKNVTIGDKVSVIGASAFEGCQALESFTLPDSLTVISNKTFKDCTSLKSMTIHSRITEIGEYAFQNCTSLLNVSIGTGVTSIGKYAFNNCSSIKELILPDSSGSINEFAFNNCTSLTSINIPSNATSINSNSFSDCIALESISIPNSVTSIGMQAFSNCTSIKEVILPNSVTTIGMQAFSDCTSIENISIGDNIKNITSKAFYNCVSLKNVSIGESVETIGESAFENCILLSKLVIPNSVYQLDRYAFKHCKSLISVIIGTGINTISDYAFNECYHLAEVYNLSTLNIRKKYTAFGYVGYYAVNVYNSLSQTSKLYKDENGYIFDIENDTTYLVGYNGDAANLTLPTLEDGKTYVIKEYAFRDTNITSIVIPNCVTKIGNYAFTKCASLTNVYYKGTKDNWNNLMIEGVNTNLNNATKYYYSETEPSLNEEGTAYDDNYWHYVDGKIVVWTKS